MKKKIIVLLIMLGMLMQSSALAMPEFPGTLDRIFDEEHTMYYVDIDSDQIPDITGDGYETVSKATKIYEEGEALTVENTTVIRNTQTGKLYRIVFTNNSKTFEVTNSSINDSGVLSIEGKIDGEDVLTMFILKPSEANKDIAYTWDDVDESDMTKTVLDVVEFRATGEGTQVTYQFPSTAGSGAYGVLIVGDNLKEEYYNPAIYYTSKKDLDAALAGLNEIVKLESNDGNAQQLVDYIKQNSRMLYIDPTYFNQLSDSAQIKACKELFKSDGYEDVIALQKQMYKSIVTAWITDGKDPETILEVYKESSVPALYNEYCGLKTKTIVNEAIAKATDSAELETIFNKLTTVEMINEAPAPEEINTILKAQMQYLGFSQEVIDKYEENENIATKLMFARPFSSAEDIEEVITEAQSENPSGNGSTGSTGGSTGGSTHSGGTTSSGSGIKAPVTNFSPEPDSEIKPEDKFVFSDCDNYEWAKTAIKHLYDNGIISGKDDTHFFPQDNITREEFVKIIVKAFDFIGSSDMTFTDVDTEEWYAEPISIALSTGIINGISDTEFGIGRNITREDMATIIYRAVQAANLELDIEIDEVAELTDLDTVSDYAKEAVEFLISKGAINGSDGKFNPKAYATRAEAAQMVYQVVKIR